MRVAICDDNIPMQMTLEKMLNEYSRIRNIDISIEKFNTGRYLLRALNVKEYEIVFMDYQMDDIDGIETSRLIRKKNYDSIIIFVSAYPEVAVDSYEVNTFRFIGKHTLIRTTQNAFEIHIHLKVIENKLPSEKFCRCHRAYIAGLAHIDNHTNTEIFFDNGERAQIGKSYSVKFKKTFQEYIMRYNERNI